MGFPDILVGKESTCNAGDPSSIPGLGRSSREGIGYPLQYSWASLMAQLVKNPLKCGRSGFNPWVGKIPWRRERLPTPVFWPGEFHELYNPWGYKESDTTDQLSLSTCHSLLGCIFSVEKLADNLMGVPLYVICLFPLFFFFLIFYLCF